MSTYQKQAEAYEQANRECAAIILADVAKFGGETALIVIWAKAILGEENR